MKLSQMFQEKVYGPQVPKNLEFKILLVNSWNFKGIQLSTQIEILKNCFQKGRSILDPGDKNVCYRL